MKNRENLQLKPSTQKAFDVVRRNMPYLESEGIIEGERTLKDIIDNFYDLGYSGSYSSYRGIPTSDRRFGDIAFDETKIGSLPSSELIGLLDEIGDKPIASSRESLKYENVREVFRTLNTPKGTTIRMSGHLAGLAIGAGGPLTTLVLNFEYDLGILHAIGYSIATFAGGIALGTKTMVEQQKAWRSIRQLHEERTKEGSKAYWELHARADKADAFIHHYQKLFEGVEENQNEK